MMKDEGKNGDNGEMGMEGAEEKEGVREVASRTALEEQAQGTGNGNGNGKAKPAQEMGKAANEEGAW